jgi:hypothetical protein
MRQSRSYGSVRRVSGKGRPYRDSLFKRQLTRRVILRERLGLTDAWLEKTKSDVGPSDSIPCLTAEH